MEFSGDILIEGQAEVNVVDYFGFDSRWFIYSEDNDTGFESFWNIGEGEQYWYRVEGYCKKIKCVDMGVEIVDDQCEAEYLFLTVVSARNLKELCQILKKPTLTAPVKIKINSVKRYSRPVVKDPEKIDDCNLLVEQKICQIPECFDFCILEDLEVQIGFSSKATRIFSPTLSGGLLLSGSFGAYRQWHKEFEPEETILNLFGISECNLVKFNYETEGSIFVNNNKSEYLASRYVYDLDAKEILLSGNAVASSPSFNYFPNGFILLEGGFNKIKSNFSFSGSLQLTGEAGYLFSYNGHGILNISSANQVLSPNYKYYPKDPITLFGQSYVNVNNEGSFLFSASLQAQASKVEVEFSSSLQSKNLSINSQIVSTPCACSDLPLFLILNHNILENALTQFLDRNSFSFDRDLPIRYKSKNRSWNYNRHFNGVGTSTNLKENWSILFELSCFEDLGDYYWNFLMYMKKSLSNNEDFETKILLSIPNSFTCVDNSFDLNLRYNTQSNEFYANENLLISNVNYDEIGLFKNKYWTSNPNFVIKIGPQRTYRLDPTVDLKPIFMP